MGKPTNVTSNEWYRKYTCPCCERELPCVEQGAEVFDRETQTYHCRKCSLPGERFAKGLRNGDVEELIDLFTHALGQPIADAANSLLKKRNLPQSSAAEHVRYQVEPVIREWCNPTKKTS